MVDERQFIKSYDTLIIIHKTNGQNKYTIIGGMPLFILDQKRRSRTLVSRMQTKRAARSCLKNRKMFH